MIHFSYNVTAMGLRPVPVERRQGVEQTAFMFHLCPRRVAWHVPDDRSQTLMVLSSEALARRLPFSGSNLTSLTSPLLTAVSSITVVETGVDRALDIASTRYTSNRLP